jgi:LacI family transcriptional regulator
MPTIQDVAKKAGVAPMTVSRVINQSGYASPEVRQRVLAAVEDLGYLPNTLARGLRIKRSQTLALIVSDITNPFFTTVARGVEDAASQSGYTVLFGNTDESEEKENRYLDQILQKQVDGILLVPVGESDRIVKRAQAAGTPLVMLDRKVAGEAVDTVLCDSEDGAYQLTRYLLELGHRQLALLAGPQGVSVVADREAGFRRALAELGGRPPQVYYGPFTQETGYSLARAAITAQPRPTAIVAANNFLTIGAYKAIRALDLEVPEDIALVGFDDLPESLLLDPIITAAIQPAYEMGRQAAELLLARLSGSDRAAPIEVVLPVQIVVRQSSGPKLI